MAFGRGGCFGLLAIVLALLGTLSSPLSAASTGPDLGASSSCVLIIHGDLQAEIQARLDDAHLPGPGSNGMVVPTAGQMAAWKELIDHVADDDAQEACAALQAAGFPYRLVYYTDASTGLAYWLLREESPISAGWGTFVIRAGEAQRDVVIEVPHPGFEVHCAEQAVGLLRALGSRALLLAGTDRCANSGYSPCAGTTAVCGLEEPFRESDVGHATQTMFQVTHRALASRDDGTVTIQLHGHSQVTCSDVLVSNGTCTPGPLTLRLADHLAAACPSFTVATADCGASECSLAGTTNVQGRYTNGCPGCPDYDPCFNCPTPPAPPVPEQFIHIEQSHAFRDNYACLVPALLATLPTQAPRRYLPEVQRDQVGSIAASDAPRSTASGPTPAAPAETVSPGASSTAPCIWLPVVRTHFAR